MMVRSWISFFAASWWVEVLILGDLLGALISFLPLVVVAQLMTGTLVWRSRQGIGLAAAVQRNRLFGRSGGKQSSPKQVC